MRSGTIFSLGRRWALAALIACCLLLAAQDSCWAASQCSLTVTDSQGAERSFSFSATRSSHILVLEQPQELEFTLEAPGCTLRAADSSRQDGLSWRQWISEDTLVSFSLHSEEEDLSFSLRLRLVEPEPVEEPLPEQPSEPPPPSEPPLERPSEPPPPLEQPLEPPPAEEWPLELAEAEDDLTAEELAEEELAEEELTAEGAGEWTAIHLRLFIGLDLMFVNGQAREIDVAPYLFSDSAGGGHTMVPVRFIAESLGAQVEWEPSLRQVDIRLADTVSCLIIGQPAPGSEARAVIIQDRTFVPLRYVMETLGAEVWWDQNEKRIDIVYQPAAV